MARKHRFARTVLLFAAYAVAGLLLGVVTERINRGVWLLTYRPPTDAEIAADVAKHGIVEVEIDFGPSWNTYLHSSRHTLPAFMLALPVAVFLAFITPTRRWDVAVAAGFVLTGTQAAVHILRHERLMHWSGLDRWLIIPAAVTLSLLGPLWALAALPVGVCRQRRLESRDGHHCVVCGYDLHGNVSGGCPECGQLTQTQDGFRPPPPCAPRAKPPNGA
ncbi:MAG: hypothetical protein PVJ57_06200 [Phycisphaerae bacterium]|jgi:hypothetical protein